MHCVSERYAFLPYRLRQEKQRGKGHHARRKDTAEGSGFLPEIRRGIRHDFPQRGRSPAAVSENRKNGESSAGQSLQVDRANKAGNEEAVNGGTGRADG